MGVSYTLPDGQLAMPAFDNGGSQASSDAMQFSMFSVPFRSYSVYCYKLHIIFIC